MLRPNSQPQKSVCQTHNLGYSDICLHENCPARCLCRACKLDHPENHLRNIFSLSEVHTGDFFASINDIITSKKESLFARVRDKNTLLKKVNAAFFDIQNEIERILIETKTEIIQSIERFYQDLNQGYSDEYFNEIQSYLKRTSEDFKKQEITQLSASLDQFSKAYFKTIESINTGIQLATKFEDSSLDVQGVLDAVKVSCATLLTQTTAEAPKESVQRNRTPLVKVAPQEIVSMCHCSNHGLFITGGSHGLLTVWDDESFSCVAQVQLHDGSIDTIVYLPESMILMTISNDSYVTFAKMTSDGNIEVQKRTKALKLIRHIESVGEHNKIAMIADQGQKIRIFDATRDIGQGEVIDVPRINERSRLFNLAEEKLVGLTYTNAIMLFSLGNLSTHDHIRTEGTVMSACYVAESRTIHVLLKHQLSYEEVIYKTNEKEKFTTWIRNKIERNAVYGTPLEIIADGSIILTVFSHAYILRKVQASGESFKFPEFLVQTGNGEYQNQHL